MMKGGLLRPSGYDTDYLASKREFARLSLRWVPT